MAKKNRHTKTRKKRPGAPPPQPARSRLRAPSDWRKIALAALLILVAAGLFHGQSIQSKFHLHYWETVQYVEHVDMYVHSFAECFTVPPLWPGLYRPISTNLYYYVGREVFHHRIEPLKVINLIVFGLNAVLLLLILVEMMPLIWAAIACLLWVTRKAQIEVVTVTVEAQTLFAVLFMLACLYAYLRWRSNGHRAWEVACYVSFGLALLSKETALATLAVIAAHWWLFDRHREWRPFAVLTLISLAWLLLFVTYARGMRDHMGTGFRYTASIVRIAGNYIAHAADFSNWLVGDASEPNMEVQKNIVRLYKPLVSKLLFLAACGGVIFAAFWRKTNPNLKLFVFGAVVFLATVSPYAITINRLFMRYSYVGHIGVSIAVVALVKMAWDGFVGPWVAARRESAANATAT